MKIVASVDNEARRHAVTVSTNGNGQPVAIAPKPAGSGSSVNGGELLCLAMATCYCNDVYREADRRGIAVTRVVVEARAEFGAAGAPAASLSYRASVTAHADEDAIRALMVHTDAVAEVQNTLRKGMPVTFEIGEAISATRDC